MYLKGVEIYGFKSFGERVKIDFNNGITSIVGPNGSGKSNILDGILWVLGEQSYKNIRAKESKDVIFSGGEGKKPATHAEVSLYIDNKDKFFQIDLEEIKITRRIDSKSENEYLINDKKVRLKDIGELFLDTGVGKSAYSVIGQGKVERIISSSNKEIKGIIEEAAGVKKFQYKKLEAEKRIAKVQGELEKLELVLNEIGENRDKIGKQSEKALKFLEVKTERDSLKKGILNLEYTTKTEMLSENIKKIEQEKQGVESLENEIRNLENEINISEERRKELNLYIDEFNETNLVLKEEIESLEKEKIKLEERKKSYERESEQKKEDLKSTEDIITGIKESSKLLLLEKEKVKEKVKEVEDKNRKFEIEISEKEKEKREIEILIELKKRKIMDSEVEKMKLINEIENSERRVKNSEFKINSLKEELESCLKKFEVNEKELAESLKEKEEKNQELKNIEIKQAEAEEKISELSKNLNKASELIRNTEFEERRTSAKLQGLHRIEDSNEGFYKGVKEVLNAKVNGVEGAVISLINVEEGYQKAIEASISGNLQDIVVTTSDVAKICIEILKEKKAGRASFLALDTIKVGSLKAIPKKNGVVGRGSDLVSSEEKYKKVVEMLLGNVLVVETIDVALDILKKNEFSGNVVTISGEILNSRGRITGGENSNSLVSQIFERKKEIKTLEELNKSQKEKLKDWNEKVNHYNKELERYEDEIGDIDSKEDSIRRQVKLANERYEDIKSKTEKIEKEKRVVELEMKEESHYATEYLKRVENSQTDKDVVEKISTQLREELDEEMQKDKILLEGIKVLKDKFSDVRILFLNSQDRILQIEKEEKRYLEEEIQYCEKKQKIEKIMDEIKKELEKISEKDDTIVMAKEEKLKKFENENQELKSMKIEKESLENKSKEFFNRYKELEKNLFKEKEILNRETDRNTRTTKEIEEIVVELEVMKEIIESKVELETIKMSKDRVKELDEKLKRFDSVNLLAIEEFKELDEKYKYLDSQKEDLVTGERSLAGLIEEVEETIKNKFYEAYNTINTNFNEMCMETLDNSEGNLSLHNSEDFENCGVEVMVKYKNKKRQALSLLSGGEKSMVAIAFIMAIFMYKPSPFTFLDEIEAALDEKNTRKLIAKLKEFTNKSQFILITHNKETMKASDSLYGVTMNKKIGISKLVPVKI